MAGTVGILEYLGLAVGYMLPKRQVGVTGTAIVMHKTLRSFNLAFLGLLSSEDVLCGQNQS